MFRYMNATKLSTQQQKVLFYPGADASQMMLRAFQDAKFLTIDKRGVKKVIVIVGTNNIDCIYNSSCPMSKAKSDINDFLYKLWSTFDNAQLHVINILPRQNHEKNAIVQEINVYIDNLCKSHGLFFVNTEMTDDHCFYYTNGLRNNQLFMRGYDNVYMNSKGYMMLAKYLKYLAHM